LVAPHAWPVGQSPVALQPQLPAMHCEPSAPPHIWQVAPVEPHAAAMVPATQLVPLQQPPLQVWPAAQPVEQVCIVRLHALPTGQSLGVLQPQVPAMQLWPLAFAVQSLQVPMVPHADGDVPGWHEPDPPQQPLEHGCATPHAVVHTCAPTSHEAPLQSLDELQPHTPLMHAVPSAEVVQSTQAAPPEPQLELEMPNAQVPLAQQPPLHNCVGLHDELHLCVVVSHDSPIGQSPVTLQPQLVIAMHTCPFESLRQSTQLVPQQVGATEKSSGMAASTERSLPVAKSALPFEEASGCGSEPFCQQVLSSAQWNPGGHESVPGSHCNCPLPMLGEKQPASGESSASSAILRNDMFPPRAHHYIGSQQQVIPPGQQALHWQVAGARQVPQLMVPPQPSPIAPQLALSCAQVFGMQQPMLGTTLTLLLLQLTENRSSLPSLL
jgi:hypothetical protein